MAVYITAPRKNPPARWACPQSRAGRALWVLGFRVGSYVRWAVRRGRVGNCHPAPPPPGRARLTCAPLPSSQARGSARSPPSLRAAGAWAVVARLRAQGMHSPARAAGQAVPRWRAACVAVGFGVMLAARASFGRCQSDLPGFAKNRVGTRPALPIPPASTQPPPVWGDLAAG